MEPSKTWTTSNYIILLVIIAVGFSLRLYGFDTRPLHHDESLHGIYSLYYFQNSATGFYKYNPLLHGPLLYHSIPWSYWLFGVGKFALRLPSVLLGSSLLFLPFLFKKHLSKFTILITSLVIATSPTMTYWSRFIRHDNFIFAALLILLFACLKTQGILRYLLVALSFGLQFSCKENTFIHVVFFFVFLIFEFSLSKLSNDVEETQLTNIAKNLLTNKLSFFIALGFFIAIFSYFYTAGFVYKDGFLDGAYRKSLFYWFEQHQRERISGPFSYTFLINVFFESWWMPSILIYLFYFYQRQTNKLRILFASSLLISFVMHTSFSNPNTSVFLSKVLKLKIPLDYYLFFPIIVHSLIMTTVHLLQQRRDLALTGFFFFSSFFTYSYLGEKVPWLAMYPLVTGILYFSFFFDKVFQKPILFLITPLILLNLRTLIWVNYTHSSHPTNLLTQVHTSKDYEELMFSTRKKMDSAQDTLYFLVYDSYTWPTTWYMHGAKGYHFQSRGKDLSTYQYVLAKPEDQRVNSRLSSSHTKETVPLRTWWLPLYKEITLEKAFLYTIKKKTWNISGGNQVSLWTKKK